MQFHTLFTVSISHTYYGQGCKDFSFVIPADSTQLLKNGKLIAKIYEGKLYVLFQQDETGQALVSLTGKTLRFGLKLLNPFFSNFTDFNLSYPLYRNSTTLGALDAAQAVTFVGNLFSYELKKTPRPITVHLKDRNDRIIQTDIVTDENDRSTISYDFRLTNRALGLYRIEESDASNIKTTNYYFEPELQQKDIFGVIEIAIADSFYPPPPPTIPPAIPIPKHKHPEFAIAFTAKQETLKYYVVAKNYSDADFAQLSVADADASPINFTKVLPEAFTVNDIPKNLLGNDEAKIALFSSQVAVARQEKARQKIQLRRNGDVLIPHLPQPRSDRATANLIVQVSKPNP
jgi:hypothetical protein